MSLRPSLPNLSDTPDPLMLSSSWISLCVNRSVVCVVVVVSVSSPFLATISSAALFTVLINGSPSQANYLHLHHRTSSGCDFIDYYSLAWCSCSGRCRFSPEKGLGKEPDENLRMIEKEILSYLTCWFSSS
jgi:hypothetical protein